MNAEEAKDIGLIHEVSSKANLIELGEKRLRDILKNPDAGRITTKRIIREQFSGDWKAYGEEEGKVSVISF